MRKHSNSRSSDVAKMLDFYNEVAKRADRRRDVALAHERPSTACRKAKPRRTYH